MSSNRLSERWYPSVEQLKNPEALASAFRQLLDQHYKLQDKVHAIPLPKPVGDAPKDKKGEGGSFPAGSGPADSMLLGLPVVPVDPQKLADGARLTFIKAQGVFKFQ